MKRLLIVGAGDLGQQIAHFASSDKQFEVVGFVDDWQENGTIVNGVPVLGSIDDLLSLYAKNMFDETLIGVGYKHFGFRKELYDRFKDKIPFATFVHSSCYVDPTAEIGKGVVIYPRCIIDSHVRIQNNVLVNFGVGLGHDSVIGSHSFLAPMVSLSGKVETGEMCFMGTGAVVLDHLILAKSTTIGGGAVVVKNIIESNSIYVGNPARFLKNRV